MHTKRLCAAVGTIALLSTADAGSWITSTKNLVTLSLEELSNIEITSVSKREERLSDAPTSVFIITGDDIRRSGATSLPEALRLAPNLQVARASANGWAITARGFAGTSANKLLVLIDGRSVYSPLFSGVFWDVQDLMLEDVERIEVISGPGGTLWGVNAVNGVVNVITRASGQTQGHLVAAGAGNREAQLAWRYGGALDSGGHYRAYGKQSHRSHTRTAAGSAIDDASRTTQLGVRADWDMGADRFTLQGDVYDGKRDQPLPGTIAIEGVDLALGTISVAGANLIARWEHRLDADASVSGQFTYDRVERTVVPTFADKLDIADLQVQHAWRPAADHAVVWGAQYRYAMDDATGSTYVAFLPSRVNQSWVSLFAQDEITLSPALRLTVGARAERNDYTGTELLPNLRLAWKPTDNHLLWSAASRTVRAPSRLDRDTFVPGQPPFLLAGGPEFKSEVARVYEVGYRGQPARDTSYSVTAFHADYDRLHTQELAPSGTFLTYGNGMEGRVRGLEMWGSYQATPAWRLHAGFSRLWQDLRLKPGSSDYGDSVGMAEGTNPSRQWQLRSSLDLSERSELDVTTRYVSELDAPPVPSYLAVDLRWGWRPQAGVELSITGQNLFGPEHGEFTDVSTRTAFSRAVFIELVSQF